MLAFLLFCYIDITTTTVLMFEAQDYPIGYEMELTLKFPIASGPQNYFTKVSLHPTTEGVVAGGMIHKLEQYQQVFQAANITIVDNAYGKLV